jgi:hypothetical protein
MTPRRGEATLHELPDGTPVLSNKDRTQLLVLNDLGAAVWELLDGERSIDDVVREIVALLPADPESVRSDVERFVTTLGARGFLA